MNITVREIRPDDAEVLAHIIVTAIQNAFAGLVPDNCLSWLTESERAACYEQALAEGRDPSEALVAADEARSAKNWRESLAQGADPGEVLLLAEVGGIAVGYAIAGPSDEDPEYRGQLHQIAILPSLQRIGAGRVLVREAARRLAEQGIDSMRVGVLRINPNRPFYERLGGKYLYDRDYDWSGSIQPECFYGWKDTQVLLEGAAT